MSGAELAVAEEWIVTMLAANWFVSGAVSGRVWEGEAPSEDVATYPFIIYQNLDASDLVVVGNQRVWTDTLYVVKAIAQAENAALAPIASALDVALTSNSGSSTTTTAGIVWCSSRQKPFQQSEIVNGKQVRSLGGVYRIYAT